MAKKPLNSEGENADEDDKKIVTLDGDEDEDDEENPGEDTPPEDPGDNDESEGQSWLVTNIFNPLSTALGKLQETAESLQTTQAEQGERLSLIERAMNPPPKKEADPSTPPTSPKPKDTETTAEPPTNTSATPPDKSSETKTEASSESGAENPAEKTPPAGPENPPPARRQIVRL